VIIGNEKVDYAYAVGRIRVLETRLLSRGMVERMLEAADVNELYRILSDTAYGALLSETTVYGWLLRTEEIRTIALFDELCVDPILSELIHYRYDFHNLKVLMKAYVAKADFGHLLSPNGNFDLSLLRGAFEEEKFGALPDILQQIITRALEQYYSKNDPRLIDLIVDQEMFQFYTREVAQLKNDFLTQLLALIKDLENIKTLVRAKRLDEDRETMRLAILEGGNLSSRWYLDLAEEAWENLPQRFYATPYFQVVDEGYGHLEREKSFLQLEKLCDDFLTNFLRTTRYTPFGIEPLIAYLVAKLSELKILKLLFVGKSHGIETARMKQRLPDVF